MLWLRELLLVGSDVGCTSVRRRLNKPCSGGLNVHDYICATTIAKLDDLWVVGILVVVDKRGKKQVLATGNIDWSPAASASVQHYGSNTRQISGVSRQNTSCLYSGHLASDKYTVVEVVEADVECMYWSVTTT